MPKIKRHLSEIGAVENKIDYRFSDLEIGRKNGKAEKKAQHFI